MPSKSKRKAPNYNNKYQIAKLAAQNVFVTLACVLLLCAVAAGAALKLDLDKAVMYYIGIGIIALSAFVNGIVFSSKIKIKGWLIGLVSNAFLLILITVLHFFVKDEAYSNFFLCKYAVIAVFGVAGGIAGVNRKKKIKIK